MADSGSDEYPRAPAQKARDENILEIFEETTDPVLATSEVAEELPIGKRATLNRLEDLAERDELEWKDIGVGRVWWRAEPDDDPAPEPEPKPGPENPDESVPASPAPGPAGTPAASRPEPLESESPRWAFIGSLGRHSIFAGAFLLALLLIEGIVQQPLLPVSVVPVFVTSVVFFLIGFPARAAYRTKKYFESTNLSLSQVVPTNRIPDRESGD